MGLSLRNILKFAPWALLLLFAILQMVIIIVSAVDIPYWDEWSLISLIDNLSLSSVLGFHNEHRVVFSKLIIIAEYYLHGLNFRYHAITNAIILTTMVFTLYFLLSRIAKDIWFLPLLFIPYFTRVVFESYIQDMSSTNLMLIFSFLAIYFGFYKPYSIKNNLLMLLFLFMSILAFSFTFAAGIMIVFLIRSLSINYESKFNNRIIMAFIVTIIFSLLIYLVFFHFGIGKAQAVFTYPNQFIFWSYFFKSVQFSALPINMPLLVSLPISLILLIIYIFPLFDKELRDSKSLWVCYALIGGVMLSIIALAYGRASMESQIAGRHRVIMIILIPITVIFLRSLYHRFKKKYLNIGLIFYLIVIALNIVTYMDYGRYFKLQESRIKNGVECVQQYYNGVGNGECRDVFPGNIAGSLDMAKRLGFSFTKMNK